MPELDETLAERRVTHGEFWLNARTTEQLIDVLRSSPHWLRIPYETRNALTMTCAKMSRLINDNGYKHLDNYVDIIGYITLAHDAQVDREQFKQDLIKEGHYE